MDKYITIEDLQMKNADIVQIHISIDGNPETITTTVSENVLPYVTIDRIDAPVFGLLFFAIKNGYDIKSDIPISSELKYKIEEHLVPALLGNEGYHKVRIEAPTIDTIEKTGDIKATGISCGVDSLYTVATHSSNAPSIYNLNHLAFFDIGSHRRGNNKRKAEELFKGRLELAQKFSNEYGFPLIVMKSDIPEIINKYDRREYSHLENDTYMTAFCVLLIQKGVTSYLVSSSNTYDNFTCRKHPKKEQFGCDNYELLLLFTCSINNVNLISSGGSIKRVDKIKYLCQYPPAWKYLNVCIESVNNDSTCTKCVRTLMAIDAFDSLDKFSNVFDISHYRRHRKEHLYEMYIEGQYKHWKIVKELFPYFQNEFGIKFKFNLFLYRLKKSLSYRLKHLIHSR